MITGYIKIVNSKDGKGKRGPWTRYSFILEKDDGTETGWISAGFAQPPFQKGDYGQLDIEQTEFGENYLVGSWLTLPGPAKADKPLPAVSTGAVSVSQAGGGYASNARDASIQYQSSRKDALQLVGLLLEHDALPISTAGAKAGTAKRYEEIKGFVDKLTVEFYGDLQGEFRVLSRVVDAGKGSAGSDAANPSAGTEDND